MVETYNVDQANLIRLKVNRINIIQSLNINDDFLSDLIKNRIIFYDEATQIISGKSKEEKAKNLYDCLIQKKPNQIRKDWYLQFRSILLSRNYNDLVTFLDNTIIQKPKFVEKFSSMSTTSKNNLKESSNITICNESDTESSRSMKKNFDDVFKNIPSYITRPEALLQQLKSSKDQNDLLQYEIEVDVYEFFKKLETYYLMYKNKDENFKDIFVLDTNVCKNILNLSSAFTGCKYFRLLLNKYDIDLLKFLVDCLNEKLNEEKVIRLTLYQSLDELIYKLVWCLIRNERSELANIVLEEYLNYLEFLDIYLNRIHMENNLVNTSNTNNKHLGFNSRELLVLSKYYALSNFICVKNNLYEFDDSFMYYNQANEVYDVCVINGNKPITTILNYAIGNTYLELGNFDKALEHLNKALLTVCYDDDLLIEILGSASICYSSKWMIEKAACLALLAVQSAKTIYGTNNSHFIRALLFYTQFSNDFVQDSSSIRLSEYTLNMANKVYNCDTIPVADAYKSLAKALTINKIFNDDIYYEYTQIGHKIAQEYYKLDSPKLIPFELSLVSALQWRSIYTEQIEIKRVNLNDAYNICKNSLKKNVIILGEKHISTAKIYRLLGSLLYYMEKDTESEKIHKKSLDILESQFPKNNLHYLLTKSTLGVFYKMIGNINEAIVVLLDVANSLNLEEIKHFVSYCRWIPSVFINLSECYRSKKSEDLANYYQKQAENLKVSSSQKSTHSKHDILNSEINRLPPSDLNKFLKEFLELKS